MLTEAPDCPYCKRSLIRQPPSQTSSAEELYSCHRCGVVYQVCLLGTGTTVYPDKYLVLRRYLRCD